MVPLVLDSANAQHFLEGVLERAVARRVQNGINGRVEVAEPHGRRIRVVGHTVIAKGHHHEANRVR